MIPELRDGEVNRTSDTAATVGFYTNEMGTAYYLVLARGADEPSAADVKAELYSSLKIIPYSAVHLFITPKPPKGGLLKTNGRFAVIKPPLGGLGVIKSNLFLFCT